MINNKKRQDNAYRLFQGLTLEGFGGGFFQAGIMGFSAWQTTETLLDIISSKDKNTERKDADINKCD